MIHHYFQILNLVLVIVVFFRLYLWFSGFRQVCDEIDFMYSRSLFASACGHGK